MVFRRCAGKGNRADFRLGYMGGCVKKNRNTEKWYAQAKRGKVKCRLHPLIHTLLDFNLVQNIGLDRRRVNQLSRYFFCINPQNCVPT
jgi:hypothetical protein